MSVLRRSKLWTSLGTAVLLGSGPALADEERTATARDGAKAGVSVSALAEAAPPAGEGEGEGEGGEGAGEGGENGGEFGVDAAQARVDPVVYGIALDVIRAHYLAGQAAYAAGDREAAGELFVHPISEVYLTMEPVFAERGVDPFDDLMSVAGGLAIDGAPVAKVEAAVTAVLEATDAAEAAAPEAGDAAPVDVTATIVADMIERAALQYQIVAGGAEGAAYLDGYGFAAAARLRAEKQAEALAATPAKATIDAALGVLARAYPSATKPDALPVAVSEVLAASSAVKLVL